MLTVEHQNVSRTALVSVIARVERMKFLKIIFCFMFCPVHRIVVKMPILAVPYFDGAPAVLRVNTKDAYIPQQLLI